MKLSKLDIATVFIVVNLVGIVILAFRAGIRKDDRDMEEARSSGETAAKLGLPPQSCQYGEREYRQRREWMLGWQEETTRGKK